MNMPNYWISTGTKNLEQNHDLSKLLLNDTTNEKFSSKNPTKLHLGLMEPPYFQGDILKY